AVPGLLAGCIQTSNQSLLLVTQTNESRNVLVKAPCVLRVNSVIVRLSLEGGVAKLTAVVQQIDALLGGKAWNGHQWTLRAASRSESQREDVVRLLADSRCSTAAEERSRDSESIRSRNRSFRSAAVASALIESSLELVAHSKSMLS